MTDITIQQANGFLVTYEADGANSWELCEDLKEARAAYSEPPRGWTSIGISACKDGVPFASLDVPRIQIFTPRSVVTA